jgi:hypothetical protein
MFLAWFNCFANKKKHDMETVKYERIKYLPFAWKQNVQQIKQINEKGYNLQNSAKEYRNLSKELGKNS